MRQPDAWCMIRRRAVAVGIMAPIGNHSFRATGITAYLPTAARSSTLRRWRRTSHRARRSSAIGPRNASPRTRWRASGCNVTYSEGTAWPVVLPHLPSPNRQTSPLDRSGVYGTSAYLRYNQAATLDPSPLITNATLRCPVLRPVGGPGSHDAKAHEMRQNFSEK